MRDRILEIATKLCDDVRIAPDNPTILYDLLTECQAELETVKNACKDAMIAKKKEEYYKTLLDKKNLGIK
jgi:hypothetical protein